jgi:hypothetical protein
MDDVAQAASICAGYTKAAGQAPVDVDISSPTAARTLQVTPISPETIQDRLIG